MAQLTVIIIRCVITCFTRTVYLVFSVNVITTNFKDFDGVVHAAPYAFIKFTLLNLFKH